MSESTGSSALLRLHTAQEDFQTNFGTDKYPAKSVIQRWIKNFDAHGTVGELNRASRDREITQEALSQRYWSRDSFLQSPKQSSRKRCQSLNLTKSRLMGVLKDDLNKYPYRIQMVQKLTTADKTKREAMAVKLLENREASPTFLSFLWTSDEAHFDLEGKVNSNNNVFIGDEKPREVCSVPLHSDRCLVHCLGCHFRARNHWTFEESGK